MSAPASPTRVNRNANDADCGQHAEVAGERQDRAGAGGDAVDRGDHRQRALAQRLDDRARSCA